MNYQEWRHAHAFRIPQKALEDLDAMMNSTSNQIASAALREREEAKKLCKAVIKSADDKFGPYMGGYADGARSCLIAIENWGTK